MLKRIGRGEPRSMVAGTSLLNEQMRYPAWAGDAVLGLATFFDSSVPSLRNVPEEVISGSSR